MIPSHKAEMVGWSVKELMAGIFVGWSRQNCDRLHNYNHSHHFKYSAFANAARSNIASCKWKLHKGLVHCIWDVRGVSKIVENLWRANCNVVTKSRCARCTLYLLKVNRRCTRCRSWRPSLCTTDPCWAACIISNSGMLKCSFSFFDIHYTSQWFQHYLQHCRLDHCSVAPLHPSICTILPLVLPPRALEGLQLLGN